MLICSGHSRSDSCFIVKNISIVFPCRRNVEESPKHLLSVCGTRHVLQNRICIPELLPARIEGALKVPRSIHPILAHLLQGRSLHIITTPNTIGIVKHARIIKSHMGTARRTTLNAGCRISLILVPSRSLIFQATSSGMVGVEGCGAFLVCSRQ